MTDPDSSAPGGARRASGLRTIGLLLAVNTIHQIGTGLVFSLIPLRLALESTPAWIVGAISTAWSVGYMLACLSASAIASRVGARRSLVVWPLLNAVAAAMLALSEDPAAWALSRFIAGFATGSLFAVVEAWLGADAPPDHRGVVFGAYMVTNRIMFTLGQLSLVWLDPHMAWLFLAAAAAYALAPLPSWRISTAGPMIPPRRPGGLLELPRQVPAASAGAFAHALLTVAPPALFPIVAVSSGMSVEHTALGLAAIQFGGLIAQFPLTLLSDRHGRRSAMVIGAIATGLGSVLVPALQSEHLVLLLAAVALWGGAPSALYALAAAHANDIATEENRVAWSSGLMLNWGIGGMISPFLAALLMDRFGPSQLFVFTGVVSALLVLFLLWRKLVRSSVAVRKPVAGLGTRTPDMR